MTSHSRRANWLTVYIFSNLGFATSRPTCARSANPNVSDATPPKAQLREPQAQRIICAFSMISAYLRAVWKSYTGTHAPRRLISATMLARGADGLAGARGCGVCRNNYFTNWRVSLAHHSPRPDALDSKPDSKSPKADPRLAA